MTWPCPPVGGDLVVGFDRGLRIGLRQFGRFAQPRQHAIAGGAVGRELGEGRFGLLRLAGFRKRHRLLECRSGFGGPLGFPPFVCRARPPTPAMTRMQAAMM